MDNSPSTELYNLLVTRDFEPEILDINGREIDNPADAEMYNINFSANGTDYGTVVLMLGTNQDLQVYYGDNISRDMSAVDKKEWFKFLRQIKNFSARNMLSFDLKNLNKLKFAMKGMSAIKEGLREGYYGNRRVSYSDQPESTRLVIKHSRPLGEGEARYRAIESLFVETGEGERFKLPFTKLAGGRAMARHIAEGGKPYDAFGKHIVELVSEMDKLSRFVRSVRNRTLDPGAAELAEEAIRHYGELKAKAKRMISRRGYHEAIAEFNPESTDGTHSVEELRDLFIEQSLDSRIEEALPILARLKQTKESKMKEITAFEDWAESVTEGTWALPDDRTKLEKLKQLLSKELPVGTDATNATEQIYDLIGDDELFDKLAELADQDPNADARPLIVERLKELGYEIESANEDIDTSGIMSSSGSSVVSESINRIKHLSRI